MLQDKGSGLSNIWLENGYRKHETKWGQGTSIDDADGLSRAIALELCISQHQLTGEAVRYLRRRLEMTQDELGVELGCTGQAVAKWEKGDVAAIPTAAARMLRLLVLSRIVPGISLKQAIVSYNEPSPEKMVFSYSEEFGWKCADHQHDTVTAQVRRTNVIDFAEIMSAAGISVRVDAEAFCAFAHNDNDFERHATKLTAA